MKKRYDSYYRMLNGASTTATNTSTIYPPLTSGYSGATTALTIPTWTTNTITDIFSVPAQDYKAWMKGLIAEQELQLKMIEQLRSIQGMPVEKPQPVDMKELLFGED